MLSLHTQSVFLWEIYSPSTKENLTVLPARVQQSKSSSLLFPPRCFHHLLAPLLHHSHPEHALRLQHPAGHVQRLHVARLCQQSCQPDYLHHLQHRVPQGFHEDPPLLKVTNSIRIFLGTEGEEEATPFTHSGAAGEGAGALELGTTQCPSTSWGCSEVGGSLTPLGDLWTSPKGAFQSHPHTVLEVEVQKSRRSRSVLACGHPAWSALDTEWPRGREEVALGHRHNSHQRQGHPSFLAAGARQGLWKLGAIALPSPRADSPGV